MLVFNKRLKVICSVVVTSSRHVAHIPLPAGFSCHDTPTGPRSVPQQLSRLTLTSGSERS